jgi:hypothetical protein
MATVTLSGDTRDALGRTIVFLEAQAEWLARTGSAQTLPQVRAYIATLQRLMQAGPVEIGDAEKDHVQQAAFILEGARNSYRNADFKDRAAKVQDDVARLYEIVKEYNDATSH